MRVVGQIMAVEVHVVEWSGMVEWIGVSEQITIDHSLPV